MSLGQLSYAPSKIQDEFHRLRVDEALFGGSAGPGKSMALRADPVVAGLVSHEHDRCRRGALPWGSSQAVALYLRRTMPRQEENIKLAYLFYRQVDKDFRLVDQKSRVIGTFKSGMQVIWSHLKDPDSVLDHRSNAYTRIYFDELTEFEEMQYHEMVSRCRASEPQLTPFLAVRSATNPAPNWVRDYFVEPNRDGREVFKKVFRLKNGVEKTRTRVFIPARLSDNPDPVFRENYEANLRDKPSHIRRALLEGDWYVVAGAFFSDVFDPSLVVIDPFIIPRQYPRFRMMDWGLKSECVVLWAAVDPGGRLIIYRERTFNGKTVKNGLFLDARSVAERIRDIEMSAGEWDTRKDQSRLSGPADTQLWVDVGQRGGVTMAHDMASVGVRWKKASKGRAQNAQQVYRRLATRPDPLLVFFRTCKKCIETIPSLGTDENNPDSPKEGGPDHWYDALAYGCAEHLTAAGELGSGNDNARGWADDDDEDDDFDARSSWGRMGYGR